MAIFVAGGESNTKTGHGKMQRSFLVITSPVCSETQTKPDKQANIKFEFTSNHLDQKNFRENYHYPYH